MSVPEVQFVLDAVKDNLVGAGNAGAGYFGAGYDSLDDIPVRRIDRDNSDILEADIHTHSAELQEANFVGAGFQTRDATPIGTEYDHRVQNAVGVRIEGAHVSEYGHIDPTGKDGVPWRQFVQGVRTAITHERTFPDSGAGNTSYTHLELTNGSDQSSDYSDYFRYDFDVLFVGFEAL